jgi:leucyl aminopeptidase
MRFDTMPAKRWTGRTWVAFAYEGDKTPLGIAGDEGRAAMATAASERFEAKPKQVALLRRNDEKLILVGLGRRKAAGAEAVRVAAAKGLRRAEEIGATELGVALPAAKEVKGELGDFAGAAVEGFVLAGYRFLKWRTPGPDDPKPVDSVTFAATDSAGLGARVKKAIAAAEAKAGAVNFVRDLVNEPPSPKAPEVMGKLALELAVKGRIVVEVLHRAELEKLGCGGILRVGAGSHQPPCLVRLTYTPKGKSKKTAVIIGKGITFDSGGLSIKPATGMEYMKDDMAGAGAVLGLFKWLASAELPVTVHGFAAFAENMPGGGAQKPGDVIRHHNGKTAEVISTDAEGRHLLADCLALGSELKPDVMIDMATLTGACVVALGDEYSALLGTDQPTIDRLVKLGPAEGEYFWQLPLVARYRSHLKSHVADFKHTGKPGVGGTITAGLFLKEFVADGVPWVHIDIAGPSFTKEGWDYISPGASGVPLRTLIEYLRGL